MFFTTVVGRRRRLYAAAQRPPSSHHPNPLSFQSHYPQGHAEDVVDDCEEPHHGAQVEPRPAEDREERVVIMAEAKATFLMVI
jgi:hypothetical protein